MPPVCPDRPNANVDPPVMRSTLDGSRWWTVRSTVPAPNTDGSGSPDGPSWTVVASLPSSENRTTDRRTIAFGPHRSNLAADPRDLVDRPMLTDQAEDRVVVGRPRSRMLHVHPRAWSVAADTISHVSGH